MDEVDSIGLVSENGVDSIDPLPLDGVSGAVSPVPSGRHSRQGSERY